MNQANLQQRVSCDPADSVLRGERLKPVEQFRLASSHSQAATLELIVLPLHISSGRTSPAIEISPPRENHSQQQDGKKNLVPMSAKKINSLSQLGIQCVVLQIVSSFSFHNPFQLK